MAFLKTFPHRGHGKSASEDPWLFTSDLLLIPGLANHLSPVYFLYLFLCETHVCSKKDLVFQIEEHLLYPFVFFFYTTCRVEDREFSNSYNFMLGILCPKKQQILLSSADLFTTSVPLWCDVAPKGWNWQRDLGPNCRTTRCRYIQNMDEYTMRYTQWYMIYVNKWTWQTLCSWLCWHAILPLLACASSWVFFWLVTCTPSTSVAKCMIGQWFWGAGWRLKPHIWLRFMHVDGGIFPVITGWFYLHSFV